MHIPLRIPSPGFPRGGARRAIGAMLTGVLAATATPVATAAAAAEPTTARVTALPFASFGDLAVHPGSGRVFLSGGDQVVVTDRTGRIIRTLAGQAGAATMAFNADGSRLYVALNGARAISVIDTRRLREVTRFGTGDECPSDLAFGGDRLWFSASCSGDNSASLGVVDLTTAVATTFPRRYLNPVGAPVLVLVRRPGREDILVVMTNALPGVTRYAYDVSTGELEPIRPAEYNSQGWVRDVAATGDGRFIVGDLVQDHQVYSAFDLGRVGSYPTGRYPEAVAVGADGRVAAGVSDEYGTGIDLFGFAPGATQPSWTYNFGLRDNGTKYQTLAARGLGWAPDNRRVYAVTTTQEGAAPRLHTLLPPPTATPPPAAAPGR